MKESDASGSGLLIITEAEAGIKLLRFLERKLGLPRPSLFRLLRTGQVRVNKGRAKPERTLLAGDELRIPPQYAGLLGVASVRPAGPDGAGTASNNSRAQTARAGEAAECLGEGSGSEQAHSGLAGLDLNILRAEKHYLVIDKPAGLPVQPGSGHADSVSERLRIFAAKAGLSFTPAPAHRLDRQSSGILLAGRSYVGQRYLHGLFAAQEEDDFAPQAMFDGAAAASGRQPVGKTLLDRRYLAWVSGLWSVQPDMADKSGADESSSPIGQAVLLRDAIFQACGPDGYERMYALGSHLATGVSHSQGKPLKAAASFRLLKRLDVSPIGPASLLEVRLLSGRKHQIRVQCASRGFPLIGDKRYGGPSFDRMLLHACSVRIPAGSFMNVEFAAAAYFCLPEWPGCFSVSECDLPG